ncbi:uncharacterized protein [Spinacia oleracea]|uniref:RNase H type-1 domain-containing protein n=1 Tax=Spinacia oleracea TaxID=3562 RepID=A0ABM3RHL9_SPIOL|nr:uncharacterized protein LOC130469686 [Spinacia oleracea]
MVRWLPPPSGAFKLNFDGSCKCTSVAAGIILIDNNVKTSSPVPFNMGNTQVYMAEPLGLHKGIQEAIRLNIKGDNLLVINAVKGVWKIPWKLQNIINDIKLLLQQFHSFHIQHIFREANRATDWIANVGHLIVHPDVGFCWSWRVTLYTEEVMARIKQTANVGA